MNNYENFDLSTLKVRPAKAHLDFHNMNNLPTSDIHLSNELPDITCTQILNTSQNQERYVWEMRPHSPNLTPSSTVLNSPDLSSDLQFAAHIKQSHHQIRVGRSPGSHFEPSDLLTQDLTCRGSPTDVGQPDGHCLRDGEIVVFDDIDTSWMNKSSNSNQTHIQDNLFINNEDILKVTKMIGQLPIAEYEGSPRRIGNHAVTTKNKKSGIAVQPVSYHKRPPGFPQRIPPKTKASSKSDNLQDFCSANSSSEQSINKKSIGNLIDIEDDSCDNKAIKMPAFEYLYECTETRKVLEEFFKGNIEDTPANTKKMDYTDELNKLTDIEKNFDQSYVGQRLARIPKKDLLLVHRSPKMQQAVEKLVNEQNDNDPFVDSNSRSSTDIADTELEANLRRHSRNFTLSPETTDYDSNCGDLDSLSNDINCQTDYGKLYTSMPVLEDGLSSGHASDTENNVASIADGNGTKIDQQNTNDQNQIKKKLIQCNVNSTKNVKICVDCTNDVNIEQEMICNGTLSAIKSDCFNVTPKESRYDDIYAPATTIIKTPATPPAIPVQQQMNKVHPRETADILEAMKEIRSALQRAKTQPETLKFCDEVLLPDTDSPVWVPRKAINETVLSKDNKKCNNQSEVRGREEDDADTDLETDRLLGQQRHDERPDIFDDNITWPRTSPYKNCESKNSIPCHSDLQLLGSTISKPQTFSSATIRQGIGTSLTSSSPGHCQISSNNDDSLTSPEKHQYTKSPTGSIKSLKDFANIDKKSKARNKEGLLDPAVLIEGVLFRARYLGSTQLVCEGQPTKSTRMLQAEEAVSRIKAPEGENQPSTEVDLFISTEKIMVLNTDLKEIMMDHALRTISYIADIGDLVVLMARRRFVSSPDLCGSDSDSNQLSDNKENGRSCKNNGSKHNRTPKMICHVFESDEAQFIAQSIGQAFQVAYMEFLKANGIENENLAKEMDYQEVLNSQEIFGDELEIFAKKELQKEVVVPKAKGEILGVVIVESGWGSMLPTVVIANLMSGGAAARCGQLNIGDQLIAINGLSLVGLPLSTCQNYIRNTKNQTAVKFTVVPCPPVVEVKIIRPKALFQLGFSVQNGVICSLLRGGIAERGGVRVGHRIIEINNQSVVAVPHDTIVKLLSSSVGEILMKTMPTSMFRLLTGQETPIYI